MQAGAQQNTGQDCVLSARVGTEQWELQGRQPSPFSGERRDISRASYRVQSLEEPAMEKEDLTGKYIRE